MPQVKRHMPNVTEVKDLFGAETKVLDKAAGIVEAIVSVTGIKDEVDDVLEPGLYAKTLLARKPKGIRSHDWDRPAAKTLKIAELLPGDQQLPDKTNDGEPWPRAAGALKVLMQYNLDTKDGAEGFSDVQFYADEQQWSIGYHVGRGHARMVKGIRHVDVMTDLFEYSDVLWGAMPLAGTTGVKAHGGLVQSGGLWVPDGAGLKSLAGSDEARRDALEEALNAAYRAEFPPDDSGSPSYGGGYQMIRATFADRVVACFHHDGDRQDWEYDYVMDGDSAVLGDRRPVKVEESLVPDTAPDVADAVDAAVAATAPAGGYGTESVKAGIPPTVAGLTMRLRMAKVDVPARKTGESDADYITRLQAAASAAKVADDEVEVKALTADELTAGDDLRAWADA